MAFIMPRIKYIYISLICDKKGSCECVIIFTTSERGAGIYVSERISTLKNKYGFLKIRLLKVVFTDEHFSTTKV